jgi:Transcriptional regulator
MLDKLRSMAIFFRVAEAGSFRRAAERLDLSASVVSHHVSQLEQELGVQLLYRSTRHVVLTDKGEQFYKSCQQMVASAEDALWEIHDDQPRGRLWIIAPAPFSVGPFMDDIADFALLYPEVALKVEFDDGARNLIQEGIDVAITFTPPQHASLVSYTLFSNTHALYASPSYLERIGEINSLAALEQADWVTITTPPQLLLRHDSGTEQTITPKWRISVNNIAALHHLALTGVGVVCLPQVAVETDIDSSRLIRILPDWQSDTISCYAVYPARARPNSLVRHFVDFLHHRMQMLGESFEK